MLDQNAKVWALKNHVRGTIEIYFSWVRDGMPNYLENLIVRQTANGEMPPETPLKLSENTAQVLMDSLWDCGIRPSEESGSAGALRATQEHLKDLQEMNARLFAMVEKK